MADYLRTKEWLEDKIAQGKKKRFAEVVALTPLLAKLLLARNPSNRPISKLNALNLQRDIADEKFVFNGQSIVVSNTGILNDGQHRCEAVAQSGRTIETVMVFGADEEARFFTDLGKPKSAGNLLHMKGRKYASVLAASVSFYVQLQKFGTLYNSGTQTPSKATIIKAVEEMKGIEKSVEFTVDSVKTVRRHAVLAFCHFVFKRRADVETADEFILRLIDGDGLRRGSPIHYCRNRLLSMGRGYTARDCVEIIFKCWNAWRANATIDHLKLSGGRLPKLER
jgi:hypothetical protein